VETRALTVHAYCFSKLPHQQGHGDENARTGRSWPPPWIRLIGTARDPERAPLDVRLSNMRCASEPSSPLSSSSSGTGGVSHGPGTLQITHEHGKGRDAFRARAYQTYTSPLNLRASVQYCAGLVLCRTSPSVDGSVRQPLCLIARRVPLGTVCVWFASLKNDVTGPRVLVVPAALCQQNGAFSRRALADWEGSHSLHRSTDGACDRSTARETYPSGPSSRKARRHHFAATR
jgi:hypothetical protein